MWACVSLMKPIYGPEVSQKALLCDQRIVNNLTINASHNENCGIMGVKAACCRNI